MSDFGKDFVRQLRNIAAHSSKACSLIEKQTDAVCGICREIDAAGSVHVYGKGRSGAVAVSLALRLKHFGYNTWFVGDIVKEGVKAKDVVILFSGSGETSDVVEVAERAKGVGAKVVSITSFCESSLGKLSDIVVLLPGGLEKGRGWDYLTAQLGDLDDEELYGGGEFELYAFLLQEAFLSALGRSKSISQGDVLEKHERDTVIRKRN